MYNNRKMAKTNKTKSSKNIVKQNADKNPIPGNKKFGIDQPQPSPSAKRKGWELRRAKLAIIKSFSRFTLAEYGELAEIARKFKSGDYTDAKGKPLKVHEVKAIKYILNGKLDSDYMNRALEYAKQVTDVTSNGKTIGFGLSDVINE